MTSWLTAQFSAWQEIVWGLVLLFAGLYLEDWIDRYRGRKGRRGQHGTSHH